MPVSLSFNRFFCTICPYLPNSMSRYCSVMLLHQQTKSILFANHTGKLIINLKAVNVLNIANKINTFTATHVYASLNLQVKWQWLNRLTNILNLKNSLFRINTYFSSSKLPPWCVKISWQLHKIYWRKVKMFN